MDGRTHTRTNACARTHTLVLMNMWINTKWKCTGAFHPFFLNWTHVFLPTLDTCTHTHMHACTHACSRKQPRWLNLMITFCVSVCVYMRVCACFLLCVWQKHKVWPGSHGDRPSSSFTVHLISPMFVASANTKRKELQKQTERERIWEMVTDVITITMCCELKGLLVQH